MVCTLILGFGGLMMIWHLDDGVLGHTCHGDGVLDEALVA